MVYKQHWAGVLLASFAAICLSPRAYAASPVRSVALSGQQAPGRPPGEVFSFAFGTPTLNSLGRVAFSAATRVGNTSANSGIWTDRTGTLELFVLGGGVAPGSAPHVYYPTNAHINNAGNIAFHALLEGADVTTLNNYGLWWDVPGSITKLARTGDIAPDTHMGVFSCSNPGVDFDGQPFCGYFTMEPALLNDAGQALIHSQLYDSFNPEGLWSTRTGRLRKVVLLGELAPGINDEFSGFASQFVSQFAAINNSGDIAFSAFIRPGRQGVWISKISSGSSVLSLIAGTGTSAGDILPGVTFHSASLAGFNDSGQVGMVVGLEGDGVTFRNDLSLWRWSNGDLQLIAREGQSIPGTDLTFQTGNFNFAAVSINRKGTFVFSAKAGPQNGIFTADENGIYLMALGGQHAPGTQPGVVFDDLIGLTGNVAINSAGQVAFFARLNGPGVTASNDKGIWATDRAGVLRLIVREGDAIEYLPGQFGTVSDYIISYLSSGDEEGSKMSFNDKGQIAFVAQGSGFVAGIFISDAATVPEPPALLLTVLGLLGVLRRRKR